jgi:hypothetical protein
MKLVYSLAALTATALSAVKAQQVNYGQCGGINWTGIWFLKNPEIKLLII